MFLYLIRHAIAVPGDSPALLSDAARELTPDGIKRMRRHARALARLGIKCNEIWTSPLIRARQTADLLGAELDPSHKVRVVKGLEPDSPFQPIVQRLSKHQRWKGVALVGHEPWLGEFATYLLTGVKEGVIQFRKGGAASIEIDDFNNKPIHGRLCWLLTPRQLRAIES